jgi:hypothetical protein
MKFNRVKSHPLLTYLSNKKIKHMALGDLLLKLFFLFCLIVATLWIMPQERPFEYSSLTINSIAHEEVIAPFKFAILKTPEEIAKERLQARLNIPPVFVLNTETKNQQLLALKVFQEELLKVFTYPRIEQLLKVPTPPEELAALDSLLKNINTKFSLNINKAELKTLYKLHTNRLLDRWFKIISENAEKLYEAGIINRKKADFIESKFAIVDGDIEIVVNPNEVFDKLEAINKIVDELQSQIGGYPTAISISPLIINQFLEPNLIFDETTTSQRKAEAEHNVPLTRGYVEQDERIIDNNERVTEEIYQKLRSLEIAQKERISLQKGWNQVRFQIGRICFVLLMFFLVIIYLFYYRRKIFDDNRMLAMISIIYVIQLLLTGIIIQYTNWNNLTIPVILAPMLLAMLLDFGIAFITIITFSMVMGAAIGYDYQFAFMTIIVGSIAIFSVQKIRNRGQMFRAIFYIILGYFVVQIIFGLMHAQVIDKTIKEFVYFVLPNAILTPTLAYFMIGIFERTFDVTTDITLLELSDMNHPLLQQLSVKAPGTFHHSIIVANIAVKAAEAIGANALLTRVGCYFHDIGKMDKPEYFIENQKAGENKHDSLTPSMSHLILVNHVKEGLRLAEQYRLPKAVRQFIAEHHGTTLAYYFYQKAVSLGENVTKDDFRYPGPKPQSRETAISLLADSLEAATRAVKNPTEKTIRDLIQQIFEQKFADGQFDECDLTVKDIAKIKEALLPVLKSIYHVRVEYPDQDDNNTEKQNGSPKKVNTKTQNELQNKKPDTAVKPQDSEQSEGNEEKK